MQGCVIAGGAQMKKLQASAQWVKNRQCWRQPLVAADFDVAALAAMVASKEAQIPSGFSWVGVGSLLMADATLTSPAMLPQFVWWQLEICCSQ